MLRQLFIFTNILLILFNPIWISLKILPPYIGKPSIAFNNYIQYNMNLSWLELFIYFNLTCFLCALIYRVGIKKINKATFKQYGSVQKLKKMNWEDYEELVKKIFQNKGYSVSRIGGNGSDGGIDLIIKKTRFGLTHTSMVQCKRYNQNVGVKTVREMYAVGIHNKFKHVYIYTTADFTKEAKDFAKGKNMTLVNGEQTIKEMKK